MTTLLSQYAPYAPTFYAIELKCIYYSVLISQKALPDEKEALLLMKRVSKDLYYLLHLC